MKMKSEIRALGKTRISYPVMLLRCMSSGKTPKLGDASSIEYMNNMSEAETKQMAERYCEFSEKYDKKIEEDDLDRLQQVLDDIKHIIKPSFEKANETLDWIESLSEDWDGEGAPMFTSEHVESVRKLVKKLHFHNEDFVPHIYPTARKTIQMEFANKAGELLIVESFEHGNYTALVREPDGHSIQQYGETVERLVDEFFTLYSGLTAFHYFCD